MKINFDMDIDLQRWAEAIGYKIVGDKVVTAYRLADFEEAVRDYVEAELDTGANSNLIEENFFENYADMFKREFELGYDPILDN